MKPFYVRRDVMRKKRVNWGVAAERLLLIAIGMLASAIIWIQVARG